MDGYRALQGGVSCHILYLRGPVNPSLRGDPIGAMGYPVSLDVWAGRECRMVYTVGSSAASVVGLSGHCIVAALTFG